MKMRNKIFWLIIIWVVTYPLGWVVYPYYWKYDIALRMGYARWQTYSELSRHILGYGILGYFFGWLSLLLALLDEPLQRFIKIKQFNLIQMACNIISTLIGIGLTKFIKITFTNPWNKKGRFKN